MYRRARSRAAIQGPDRDAVTAPVSVISLIKVRMKTSSPRSKRNLPCIESLGLFEQPALDLLLGGVADQTRRALPARMPLSGARGASLAYAARALAYAARADASPRAVQGRALGSGWLFGFAERWDFA